VTIALVVTHASPDGFLDSAEAWLSQVDQLIVVDNGSLPEWRQEVCAVLRAEARKVEFIFNERNLGVAAALNIGFARLLERGVDSAFVFDQDSTPASGMVAEILDLYQNQPQRAHLAIVAPNISVPSANTTASFLKARGRFLFRRVRCTGLQSLEDVSTVISSGALYSLDAFRQIGPFREDFFIDYVDTDYCLRAKQRGYKIVVACKARLVHQLGRQQEARLGPLTMHPTFHSPVRWYYISRNRVPMMFSHAWNWPHWLLYEMLINTYGLARLLLFEDHKLAKLLAIVLGTWDGLAHHMGPISSSRESLLTRAMAGGQPVAS
jgi:rhamnosyltransferase